MEIIHPIRMKIDGKRNPLFVEMMEILREII